ncbi:MAG: ATP-grasp domain-containing protein [Lachnospiraceae bacterium]|nr:ATP-grasp domain-containing protein [Lachnospiraceae bacterium]
MKKLLLLGGSRYLLSVIEAAHNLGIFVITCDYLPDNMAHKYADEYCNVSIIEKEKVLEVAKKFKIDGVMSFACDPGVVTAAYVAEKLKLPFQCSYESACILQDKGLFRKFLADHNFNVPHARSYTDKKIAFTDVDYFTWPVIVKPVDSAGSKGVTRVDALEDLNDAINLAMKESIKGAFIIEDFLSFDGYHSSSDPFTVNGELKFATYSDQLFDVEADNPYTPALIIWPSSMKEQHQKYLTNEIQRLMRLLNMKTGIYNIETCVGTNGKPYIMEVSPRGGGCKIAEIQKLAYGVDLIENEVRKAVGLSVNEITQGDCIGHWCEMVVHAEPGISGVLKRIFIEPDIERKYVKVIDLNVKAGDMVKPFMGANMSLGDIFLRFDSREELDFIMSKSREWLHIEIENSELTKECIKV